MNIFVFLNKISFFLMSCFLQLHTLSSALANPYAFSQEKLMQIVEELPAVIESENTPHFSRRTIYNLYTATQRKIAEERLEPTMLKNRLQQLEQTIAKKFGADAKSCDALHIKYKTKYITEAKAFMVESYRLHRELQTMMTALHKEKKMGEFLEQQWMKIKTAYTTDYGSVLKHAIIGSEHPPIGDVIKSNALYSFFIHFGLQINSMSKAFVEAAQLSVKAYGIHPSKKTYLDFYFNRADRDKLELSLNHEAGVLRRIENGMLKFYSDVAIEYDLNSDSWSSNLLKAIDEMDSDISEYDNSLYGYINAGKLEMEEFLAQALLSDCAEATALHSFIKQN